MMLMFMSVYKLLILVLVFVESFNLFVLVLVVVRFCLTLLVLRSLKFSKPNLSLVFDTKIRYLELNLRSCFGAVVLLTKLFDQLV